MYHNLCCLCAQCMKTQTLRSTHTHVPCTRVGWCAGTWACTPGHKDTFRPEPNIVCSPVVAFQLIDYVWHLPGQLSGRLKSQLTTSQLCRAGPKANTSTALLLVMQQPFPGLGSTMRVTPGGPPVLSCSREYVPVGNGMIAWPPVLLIAAFSRTAKSKQLHTWRCTSLGPQQYTRQVWRRKSVCRKSVCRKSKDGHIYRDSFCFCLMLGHFCFLCCTTDQYSMTPMKKMSWTHFENTE